MKAVCFDCGRPYGERGFHDLIIPLAIWKKISPTKDQNGLLCACCMCARLEALGLREVPAAFLSGPLRTVDPIVMENLRWIENLRDENK